MATSTIERKTVKIPEIVAKPASDLNWKVVLFNCYCHTFGEVREKVMMATRFGYAKSFEITEAAERDGSSIVCEGSEEYCKKVGGILSSVGITVSVTQ